MVKGVTQKIDEQEMFLRNKKIKKNNKIKVAQTYISFDKISI